MKVIIAGGRDMFSNYWTAVAMEEAAAQGILPTEVFSGCAQGADRCGEKWAQARSIPVRRFPAAWDVHGRAAGPIRNAEMVTEADALVALWDGKSKGTADVIRRAMDKGLKVYVFRTDQQGDAL